MNLLIRVCTVFNLPIFNILSSKSNYWLRVILIIRFVHYCHVIYWKEDFVVPKSPNGLSISFTVADHEEQSPVSGERRVSLEANANEPEEKNLANVISTDLHTKTLQHDNDRIAEETDKGTTELILYP